MYVFWFDGSNACLVIIILVYVCTCCDAADVDCLAQCGISQYGVPIGRHLLSIKRYQCHTITLQWYALCNGMCGGNIRKYSHENRRKNIVLPWCLLPPVFLLCCTKQTTVWIRQCFFFSFAQSSSTQGRFLQWFYLEILFFCRPEQGP